MPLQRKARKPDRPHKPSPMESGQSSKSTRAAPRCHALLTPSHRQLHCDSESGFFPFTAPSCALSRGACHSSDALFRIDSITLCSLRRTLTVQRRCASTLYFCSMRASKLATALGRQATASVVSRSNAGAALPQWRYRQKPLIDSTNRHTEPWGRRRKDGDTWTDGLSVEQAHARVREACKSVEHTYEILPIASMWRTPLLETDDSEGSRFWNEDGVSHLLRFRLTTSIDHQAEKVAHEPCVCGGTQPGGTR